MSVAAAGQLDPVSSLAVLLIEDDDVDRERTRRMIAKTGPPMSVFEVTTGQAAIAAITERRFDAILLDFQLPDCTALELLPSLQAISTSRCPVIILTGHGDEDLAVWAQFPNAAFTLVKTAETDAGEEFRLGRGAGSGSAVQRIALAGKEAGVAGTGVARCRAQVPANLDGAGSAHVH